MRLERNESHGWRVRLERNERHDWRVRLERNERPAGGDKSQGG